MGTHAGMVWAATVALVLVCYAARPVSSACADEAQALAEHNRLRAIHQSPALKLDKNLTKYAQDWVSQLAKGNCTLKFPPQGSNNAALNMWGAFATTSTSQCVSAAAGWYKGEAKYKFTAKPWTDNKAQFSTIGSFTMMIWKSNKAFGCGAATGVRDGRPCVVAACAYSPNGNIATDKQFFDNVKPAIAKIAKSPKMPPTVPHPSPKQSTSPPPKAYKSVLDALVKTPQLSKLLSLLTDADFGSLIADRNTTATVFAPSNKGIDNMLRKWGITDANLDANLGRLTKLLQFHIVPQKVVTSAQITSAGVVLPTLLQSKSVRAALVAGTYTVDDAQSTTTSNRRKITTPNIKAGKAVVHILDEALMPVGFA